MRLAIFSHCAIDTITIDGKTHEQIGGAACYGGLTARQLKFDVDLYTKFGKDFPMQYLTQNKINFEILGKHEVLFYYIYRCRFSF